MDRSRRRFATLPLVAFAALMAATAAGAHEGHAEEDAPAAGTPAAQVFERLKTLDGTWKGTAGPEGSEAGEATHTFRVSSAGSVVMETMFPGTDHEMINMYHLDGDDLVITHYCASGNQPRMRLAEVSEDGKTLRFVFDGGSNLDPATDGHIHEGSVTLTDDDTVEATWVSYRDGEPAGTMAFALERVE